MNAFIYLRVSTEDQIENTSLESQERECLAAAAGHGLMVVRIFREEGESAKTAKRPQLQAMLIEAKKQKPTAVVVWKIDRMARDTADYHAIRATLLTCGTKIVSATETIEDTPAGRFLETMLASVAQFDNEVRAQRTKTAMESVIAKGGYAWKAPYGYKNVRTDGGLATLESDPETFGSVSRALKKFASGAWGQVDIRKDLGFSKQRVRKMLQNTVYGGFTDRPPFGEVDGTWPGAVTREEWNMIQARMGGVQPKVQRREEFPFRGLMLCDKCNILVTGSVSIGRNDRRYEYYHCTECGNRVRADALHEEWRSYLEKMETAQTVVDKTMRKATAKLKDKDRELTASLVSQRKELVKLGEKKEKLLDLLLRGTISEETYEKKNHSILQEMGRIELQEENNRLDFYDLEYAIDFTRRLLRNPRKLWDESSLESRIIAIKAFCRRPPRLLVRNPSKSKATKRLALVGSPGKSLASPSLPDSKILHLISAVDRIRAGEKSA